MMIETYVICILFAILIKKCSLKPILKYWGTYLFICVEVFYIYLQSEIFKGDYSLLEYESNIKPIFTLILFIFIFKYKIYIQTIIASAFMGIGHLFNYIVIQANNGNMPVYPSISIYTNYAKSNVFDVVQQYNTHRILGE
jgi:hypothetical protein